MIFASDNVVGASQPVLEAILKANEGAMPSYGADPWSERARAQLREVFEHRDLQVWFVSTGTVANSLALSALVPPWGGVLCHHQGHIAMDESSAPELFTGGARLIPVGAGHGKLSPEVLAPFAGAGAHPPHNVLPRALSLTQASEIGLVYTPAEVSALGQMARAQGWRLHMDGARFANAVAALGCVPADITWRAGVDVLCLGASKNGALVAEAVIFFDAELARDFEHRVKRAGQMAAKGRFFGAQFAAWLENGHWLELARHANAQAAALASGIASTAGCRLAWPAQANEVFAVLPKAVAERALAAGAQFYDWYPQAMPADQTLAADETLVRLVCSFKTRPDEVESLIKLLRAG